MELKELKKQYEPFRTKYKLPSFKELDEAFEVAKIDTDTDTLMRVFRKAMMERVVSLLGFVEMLQNPMNAPRVYHSYLKYMSAEDSQNLEKIYAAFTELSLYSLEREIDYSEAEEAKLIIKIHKSWHEMKPLMKSVLSHLKQPKRAAERKERSYLG